MEGLELGGILGTGGFGEVRLGQLKTAGGLTRRVAVKLLHPGTQEDEDAIRRLRAEAAMLAALDHPAVVAVEDLVLIEGRIGLVMEYVPGTDMSELLKRGELPLRPGLEVLSQVADALHSAWTTHGIVHRDIKTNNIRVGPNGRVKLLDFGIAWSQERTALTQAGLVAGTRSHMAPERYDLDAEDTAATDVYALGCCLARLLTGKTLWGGLNDRQMVTLALHPDRHEKAVEKRLAGVQNPMLQGLATQMLAWECEDRPSGEVVAQALERAAGQQTGPSLRAWSRSRTWEVISAPIEPSSNASIELPRPEPKTSERRPRSNAPLVALGALLGASMGCAGLSVVALLITNQPTTQPVQPAPTAPSIETTPEIEATPEIEVAPETEVAPEKTPAAKPAAAPVRVKKAKPVQTATETEPQPETDPEDDLPTRRVTVSTVPMGMPVTVDGSLRGAAPVTLELTDGAHTVSVQTSSGAHPVEVEVGPDSPTRHIWREGESRWTH
jgi:eukaryotic-like serine/threonine-protein kinase